MYLHNTAIYYAYEVVMVIIPSVFVYVWMYVWSPTEHSQISKHKTHVHESLKESSVIAQRPLYVRRQEMYYERDTDVLSRSQCCREKAVSTAYSECVFVALVIQDGKRMHRITRHLWRVRGYRIFSHYLVKARFSEKVTEHKNVCFDFLHNCFLKNFSFYVEFSEMLS